MNKEKPSKWNLMTATSCIIRTRGRVKDGRIVHPGPGIKVLGAIDYLVNYCGFKYAGKPTKKGVK